MRRWLSLSSQSSKSSENLIQIEGSETPYSGPTYSLGLWSIANRPPIFSGNRITSLSSRVGLVSLPRRRKVLKSLVIARPVFPMLFAHAFGAKESHSGSLTTS